MNVRTVHLQCIVLLGLLALVVASAAALAVANNPLLYTQAPEHWNATDLPGPNGSRALARSDTTWFGSYTVIDGEYHALSGPSRESVMWTFDRGIGPYGDPRRIDGGEGWRSIDLTVNPRSWFRIADAALDLGAGVPPPIITGSASLWVGADDLQSDSLCWQAGAGYGNAWCQQVTTQPLAYDGSGAVSLPSSTSPTARTATTARRST